MGKCAHEGRKRDLHSDRRSRSLITKASSHLIPAHDLGGEEINTALKEQRLTGILIQSQVEWETAVGGREAASYSVPAIQATSALCSDAESEAV